LRLGSGTALIVVAAITAAPQQQPPVFKAVTQTVPLFATVTDAAGRLIPDLAKEDFEIFDNSKSQAVTLFVRRGTVSAAPAARRSRPHRQLRGQDHRESGVHQQP
jgi:hypothetical protein